MHEIGIVRSMCATVSSFAEKNQVSKIDEIVCECGELSLVIPEYVEKLYPPVAEDFPRLKGARLRLEIVPGLAECDECDEIFNVVEHKGYCPNCGSFEKQVLSGKEFLVKEIRTTENETD